MKHSKLNIINKYFSILILILVIFITGCANKNEIYYQNENYKKATKIYEKWKNVKYGKDFSNIAKRFIDNPKENYFSMEIEEKMSYSKGKEKAAFKLENIYINKGNYDKAILWMKSGNFELSKNRDILNHLFLIGNCFESYKKQLLYLNKIEEVAKSSNEYNAYIPYNLGKFYSYKILPFYNINKSIKFFKIAYKNGYDSAGIKLATMYIYDLNKEKKGMDILKRMSNNGNNEAAYKIGMFLYEKMQKMLLKYNKPCISCNFKTPLEFYIKKLTLIKLRKLYMKKNIVPWFYKSYKLGNMNGILKLISYDIDENNFNKNETYSKMNLNEVINFLNSISNKDFKAKILLAKIYEKNSKLNKINIAKNIYNEYLTINKTDAIWHLYQLNKIYYPNSNENNLYLDKLISMNFEPAILEKAYYNILNKKDINKSYQILKNAGNNNNIKALTYLSSIYLKGLIPNVKVLESCKIACEISKTEPLNRSIDMKIANCYQKVYKEKNFLKAATIYKFYSEKDFLGATHKLSNIYQKNYKINGFIYWLNQSKKLGNQNAIFTYNKMVLQGLINGNIKNSINFFKKLSENNNPKAIIILANLYQNGILVKIDPKKAIKLYRKAIKINHDNKILFKIAMIYKKININHMYDNKIKNIYNKLILLGNENAKIEYAKFLIKQKKYKKAKNILLTVNPLKDYSNARYLLYRLTKNKKYLKLYGNKTNNGYILLAKADEMSSISKRKALLYIFRSYLCNTPDNDNLIYDLMKYINNSNVIQQIYNKAKTYPKCTLK